MMTEIMNFLTNNRVIILGTLTTIGECVVIIVNTYRKIHNDQQPSKNTLMIGFPKTNKALSVFLWSANPINLFKRLNK